MQQTSCQEQRAKGALSAAYYEEVGADATLRYRQIMDGDRRAEIDDAMIRLSFTGGRTADR